MEDKINNIRRIISYICLIMKAQKESTELTKHQITIKKKLPYRNTKEQALKTRSIETSTK